MFKTFKQKFQEGFTLVEILIVVVIIGILAAIAIPTYFNYVEKAYASDANTQIKTIFEECKIWRATHSDFPSDVDEMIEEDASNISQSTLLKWQFEIDLTQSTESSSGIEGSIIATSTEEMPGGSDKKVCFDATEGRFTGYGTSEECDG
jgi:prepilin-type N-terminal cleavage/methylation domain-containing protein